MELILVVVVAVAAGLGVLSIKNTAKLAAIRAEVAKIEAAAVADVKAVIAAIKAKL